MPDTITDTDIFEKINDASSKGLESMLEVVKEKSLKNHDYSSAISALIMLKNLELGLPPIKLFSIDVKESEIKESNEEIRQINLQAGEFYEGEGRLVEAAKYFEDGKEYKRAVELLLREGSEESKMKAKDITISYIDFEKGLDMYFEEGDLYGVTEGLRMRKYREYIPYKDVHKITERFIEKLYLNVIKDVKSQIAEEEGKDNVPQTDSLIELTEGRDYINVTDFYYLDSLVGCIDFDSIEDLAIKNIILKILSYKNAKCEDTRHAHLYKDIEMKLRGKMGMADEAIPYFIGRAEEENESGNDHARDSHLERVVDLCIISGDHDRALEVIDRFLPENHKLRIEVLDKLGRIQDLLKIYKENNDPIGYALTLAKSNSK